MTAIETTPLTAPPDCGAAPRVRRRCAPALRRLRGAAAGADPLDVYHEMFRGGFGTWFSFQNTLQRAAPLMLTALCTALPARLGLVVIGGEGALLLGGPRGGGRGARLGARRPRWSRRRDGRWAAAVVGGGLDRPRRARCAPFAA